MGAILKKRLIKKFFIPTSLLLCWDKNNVNALAIKNN